MITEDYVSFEVAKLLKEKGFDVYDDGSFDSGIEIFAEYSPSGTLNKCITSKPHRKAYPAPTLQTAMKWLRKVYGLNIQPCIVRTIELKKAYNATIYSDACEQLKAYFGRNMFDGFKSYEEACEAAIKYCLTNLI